MSARFLLSTFSSLEVRVPGFTRKHHLERDEEKQQAAKNPERVDGDAHGRQKSGADQREKQQYSACN